MTPIDEDSLCEEYDQLLQLSHPNTGYSYEFYIHSDTKAIAVRVECSLSTQVSNGYYLFTTEQTLGTALTALGWGPEQRRVRVEQVLINGVFRSHGTPWHTAENFIDTPMKDLPLSQAGFTWT